MTSGSKKSKDKDLALEAKMIWGNPVQVIGRNRTVKIRGEYVNVDRRQPIGLLEIEKHLEKLEQQGSEEQKWAQPVNFSHEGSEKQDDVDTPEKIGHDVMAYLEASVGHRPQLFRRTASA